MPKVSIRIMTYNSGKFIANAIDSCLNQTFQDFEICISDDASTDNTVATIKKYQDKFPGKIKLKVQPINMGIYSLTINGNAGRRMCTGEYLAILDGDELMEPQRLEKQVEFLDANPDYIAVSHSKRHEDAFTRKSVSIPQGKTSKNVITTRDLVFHGNIFHNCYMMRNIEMLGDHSLKVMADWEFIVRLSLKGKLGYQNEKLTVKFWHSENVTRTRKNQFSEDLIISLALLEHKHPELLRYIKIRRARYYLSAVKSGDLRYLRGLVTSPISLLLAMLTKYF